MFFKRETWENQAVMPQRLTQGHALLPSAQSPPVRTLWHSPWFENRPSLSAKREKILDFFLTMPHDYPITRKQCKELGLPIVKPDDALSRKMTALHEIFTDTLLQNHVDSALIVQTENILLFHWDGQNALREETKHAPSMSTFKQEDLPL